MNTAVSLGLVMLMPSGKKSVPSVPEPISEIQVEPEVSVWDSSPWAPNPPPVQGVGGEGWIHVILPLQEKHFPWITELIA